MDLLQGHRQAKTRSHCRITARNKAFKLRRVEPPKHQERSQKTKTAITGQFYSLLRPHPLHPIPFPTSSSPVLPDGIRQQVTTRSPFLFNKPIYYYHRTRRSASNHACVSRDVSSPDRRFDSASTCDETWTLADHRKVGEHRTRHVSAISSQNKGEGRGRPRGRTYHTPFAGKLTMRWKLCLLDQL